MFFLYNLCHKSYQNELQDHENKSFYLETVFGGNFNQTGISEKIQLLFLLLARFIRLANTFHTISEKTD